MPALCIVSLCIASATILPGAARALIEAGSIEMPGAVRGIALEGGLAYLVIGQSTVVRTRANDPTAGGDASSLHVVDATSPKQPVEIANLEIEGSLRGIDVEDGMAYLAAGIAGLRVVDVSNPATPIEIGAIDTVEDPSISVEAVAVAGKIAYLARAEVGLQLIEISDPTSPAVIGSIDTPGTARGVALAGGLAYVADGEAGLRVIDVADPHAPVEIGSFLTGGDATRVVVVGHLAYVVGSGFGLRVVDVSDPGSPVGIGALDAFPDARDIAVVDDIAYLVAYITVMAGEVHRGGILAIDVSDPAHPAELGSFALGGEAIAVAGHYAHVGGGAADFGQLSVIDLSNPETPAERGVIDSPAARDIAVAGKIAYLAARSTFEVIDVSDANAPVRIADVEIARGANHIAMLDAKTCVVAGDGGLTAIDVSVASAPIALGALDSADAIAGIAVAGKRVYAISWNGIADCEEAVVRCHGWNEGFSEFDESYASTFTEQVGTTTTGGEGWREVETPPPFQPPSQDVDTNPSAEAASRLHVIDFSNRAAPVEVGAVEVPGEATGIALEGATAYVAAGRSGLRVIDVANSAAPVELASFDLEYRTARDVAVVDGLAYLAGPGYGLTLLDVMTPASPRAIGGFLDGVPSSSFVYAVRVADGLVYLATSPVTTGLLDASDPQRISVLGALLVSTPNIAVADGLTYFVGGSELGLAGVRLRTSPVIFDLGSEYRRSIDVDIDVDPENGSKPINLDSRGLLSVAILGTRDLDIQRIDPATLVFGRGGATPVHRAGGHSRDVNRDGVPDWVSHYRIPESGITSDQELACVRGRMRDGTAFGGCQSIRTLH